MSAFVFFKHTVLNLALGGLASLLVLVSIGDYTHTHTHMCLYGYLCEDIHAIPIALTFTTFTTKCLTLILSLTLCQKVKTGQTLTLSYVDFP